MKITKSVIKMVQELAADRVGVTLTDTEAKKHAKAILANHADEYTYGYRDEANRDEDFYDDAKQYFI